MFSLFTLVSQAASQLLCNKKGRKTTLIVQLSLAVLLNRSLGGLTEGGSRKGRENDGDPETRTGTSLIAEKEVESRWSGATSRSARLCRWRLKRCQQKPRRLSAAGERTTAARACVLLRQQPQGKTSLSDLMGFSPPQNPLGIFYADACMRCVRLYRPRVEEEESRHHAGTVFQDGCRQNFTNNTNPTGSSLHLDTRSPRM